MAKIYQRTVTLKMSSGAIRNVVVSSHECMEARDVLDEKRASFEARSNMAQWDRSPKVLSIGPVTVTDVFADEPAYVQ